MSYSFGLTIESLVAILLLLTIVYCARLNSRLERLRADEGKMRANVAELVTATEAAERAIAGLKATVRECRETIEPRLRDAEVFSTAMAEHLKSGEDVLARLKKITAARSLFAAADQDADFALPDKGPHADTRAMVAAAQAFAERARSRASNFSA